MASDATPARPEFSTALHTHRTMKKRPWLWIVFGYAAFMTASITAVVIAVKHKEPEVPLTHGR